MIKWKIIWQRSARGISIIGGVRMIRNKLTQLQLTIVIMAQVFAILYHAHPVWLTLSLNRKLKRTIDSLHFRALHLIIRDYRPRVSRHEIISITKELPPDKWSKFAPHKPVHKHVCIKSTKATSEQYHVKLWLKKQEAWLPLHFWQFRDKYW